MSGYRHAITYNRVGDYYNPTCRCGWRARGLYTDRTSASETYAVHVTMRGEQMRRERTTLHNVVNTIARREREKVKQGR
jgi:hypothetical protein